MNMRLPIRISRLWLLVFVFFSWCALGGDATTTPYVATWAGAELRQDEARISSVPMCRVWPGHQRELSQTELSRFVRFDAASAGTFTLRGPGVARRLKRILPLNEASALVQDGDDAMRLAVAWPGFYVFESDGLPTLHFFADPPLAPVPAPGPGGRLIRFGPGEHRPGVVAPKSGDVVVLDEGAVVYGSLLVLNATNVTVTGRGIFDGSRLERADGTLRAFRRAHGLPEIDTESACFAYSVYGSENVTVSGVTFRDAPFWTLVVRNQCRNTLVDNIRRRGRLRERGHGDPQLVRPHVRRLPDRARAVPGGGVCARERARHLELHALLRLGRAVQGAGAGLPRLDGRERPHARLPDSCDAGERAFHRRALRLRPGRHP